MSTNQYTYGSNVYIWNPLIYTSTTIKEESKSIKSYIKDDVPKKKRIINLRRDIGE
jgi:hypothetical protein